MMIIIILIDISGFQRPVIMTMEVAELDADSSEDELLQNKSQLNADSSEDEKETGSQLNADSSDEDVPVKKPEDNAGAEKSNKTNALESSDEEEVIMSLPRKVKRHALVASDDSSDQEDSKDGNKSESGIESPGGSSPRSGSVSKNKRKSKIRAAIMSDDDDEEGPSQPQLLKNKDLYDAESSEDELPDIPRYPQENDSEDSEGPDSNAEEMESLDDIKNSVVEKHKRGSERKSAQAAMMEIRSESARMTRESAIGLPYHRPKQRSLAEFLNRKRGTPEVVKSINTKRLDTDIDRLMVERENKIKDFFKADSEEENAADDEEDEDDKDYNPLLTEETQEVTNRDAPLVVEAEKASVDAGKDGVFSSQTTESDAKADEMAGEGSPPADLETIQTNESGDSLRLELGPDTEEAEMELAATEDGAVEEEKKATPDDGAEEEESLKLFLETESLNVQEAEEIPSSQTKPVNRAWARLQAIKNKIGDNSDLEGTLNVTPRIGTNPDNDDLVICEPDSEKNVSKGAQKLIEKFFTHAKAGKPAAETRKVENVKIVTKKNVDGKEVLIEEIVQYMKEEGSKMQTASSYTSFKAKMKKDMLSKKRAEVEHKRKIMKMNDEEEFNDELPEDEIVDDEEILDEEYEYDEEESEPEEDDIIIKEKKIKKSQYIDDEAEDEDESDVAGDESDESESVTTFDDENSKKTQFRKIIPDPELMSENSNQSDSVFTRQDRIRGDAETPTLNTSGKQTSAPSSNSSFLLTEPRWTPFQDRTNNYSLASADNTATSPSQSQLAKKRLGFEGLFDSTDPDVTGIDDVIGLCSGQFATQTQMKGLDTQDTVILTAAEDGLKSQEDDLHTQEDSVLLNETETHQKLNASINNILQDLGKDEESVGHGVIESDEEDEQVEDGQALKVSKKRKGRLLSDSEEDSNDIMEHDGEEENEDPGKTVNRDYDSEENETIEPKRAKQKLFTKGGKLRQDFYDIEAELSDEEGGGLGISDDEDEKDLDRLELEDGDLDDIDESEEREKVGRIHQRVLLDEDQADLRLFQERFLEDGDLHTDYKRQRQFKWNGLDDNIEVPEE